MRIWLCLSWFSYRKHNQSNSSIRLGIWANGNKGRDFKIFQLSVSVDFLNLHVPTCLGLISTSRLLVCAIFHRLGAHQDISKKVSSESVIAARVLWKNSNWTLRTLVSFVCKFLCHLIAFVEFIIPSMSSMSSLIDHPDCASIVSLT